jgi:hypothetical protein
MGDAALDWPERRSSVASPPQTRGRLWSVAAAGTAQRCRC